jgi:hypothetical protein
MPEFLLLNGQPTPSVALPLLTPFWSIDFSPVLRSPHVETVLANGHALAFWHVVRLFSSAPVDVELEDLGRGSFAGGASRAD